MAPWRFSRGIRASQLMEKYKSKPIEPLLVDIEIPPLNTITRSQQIALLTLRHSDPALQVLYALYASGHSKATRADYESLIPLGLADRDKNGYHTITPQGSWRARVIAKQIAAELGIVLIDYRRSMRRGARRVYGMSDSGNA